MEKPRPDLSPTSAHSSNRRDFMRLAAGAGASLGLASLFATPARAGAATAPPAASGKPFDLVGLKMPFRQDDPAWGRDVMWDRKLVLKAAALNKTPKVTANALLREFEDGNTIANEGCLLTCMAMVLRMLAPAGHGTWTPRTLNRAAQAAYYYTRCGLSMTTLNADLVSEVSEGTVQLGPKEEYLPAVAPWPSVFCDTAPLVRAYRSLAPEKRADFLVVLKIGTYDDTVASHYVLLDPNSTDGPDVRDAEILDPAMPAGQTGKWRLSDSSAWITGDPEIAAGWAVDGIVPMQIAGAWVYTRWEAAAGRTMLAPLVGAWAGELARG